MLAAIHATLVQPAHSFSAHLSLFYFVGVPMHACSMCVLLVRVVFAIPQISVGNPVTRNGHSPQAGSARRTIAERNSQEKKNPYWL
jgi:hypothetical protein